MGWSFGWDTKRELIGHLTSNEEYERNLNEEGKQNPDEQTKKVKVIRICLKHCYIGSAFKGTLWTVWEVKRFNLGENQPYETIKYIGCDLLQYYKGHRWGYKDLCESMGPCEVNCPLSYLDMVPVADAEWRERVRKFHVKLFIGQIVKLKDGCKPEQLKIISVRPLKGSEVSSGLTYRLPRRMIDKVVS